LLSARTSALGQDQSSSNNTVRTAATTRPQMSR
jgi:hypothetical protein